MEKTGTEYERPNVATGLKSSDPVKIHEGLKAEERLEVQSALLLKGALGKRLSQGGSCSF